MEIFKDDYILGQWFMDTPELPGDAMVMVIKRADKWIGEVRIRKIVDEKIFGSQDKKNFLNIEIEDSPEDVVINKIDGYMKEVMKYPGFSGADLRVDFVDVRGDFFKWIEAAKDRDWFNLKIMDKKDG